MKIIQPSFEILSSINGKEILKNIERAGRTCYKSQDKITSDSAGKFVKTLIASGHESVLEHEKVSVLIVCDRGVSHELVRHRIASFSQESTRYCNYSQDKFDGELTFILPFWYIGNTDWQYTTWLNIMSTIETTYNELIRTGGHSPQQARSILPNSLKTEIVVTANLREWRTIFKQRTTAAAHPQMREIMIPLLHSLDRKIPVVFSDIVKENGEKLK